MLLLLLLLPCLWTTIIADRIELQSARVTNWGDWQEWKRCRDGQFVHAVNLKYEQRQHSGDDTALNAIALFCKNIGGMFWRNFFKSCQYII